MRRIKLARVLQQVSRFLPKRYPVKASASMSSQPFFIFGSGRNGSTMLNRMLNQHPDLFLPSEQYFLGNSIIKFKLYNFLLWRDLIKIITGELALVSGSHTWDFSPEEVFSELNNADDKSLQQIIDLIYRTYGQKNKRFKNWGDTTPLNTFYLPEILSVFPKARYVFLVRDGRDVVASYKKGGKYLGELSEPARAAQHWINSIDKYLWFKKRADVHLVKYEELVTDPEIQLKAICRYLDIAFHPAMLSFHSVELHNDLYAEPQHQNLQKPVFKSSVGNYENGLEDEEITEVTRIMQKGLQRFEYI